MAVGVINIYPTPNSLQEKVDEYFDYCFIMETKYGRQIPKCIVPPTFSGLARYLGFSTRRALLDFSADNGNEMFEDIINDAKLRIEDFYEGKLVMAKGPSTGLQFALKNNCNWDDTTKQQISGDSNAAPVLFAWGFDDVKDAEVVEVLPEPKKEKITDQDKKENIEKRFDEEADESEAVDIGFTVEF